MSSRFYRRMFAVSLALLMCLVSHVARAAETTRKDPAPPTFSTAGGIFTNDFAVELSAGKAVVRFTIDGSEPTAQSETYEKPISISRCIILRAKAFYPDGRASRPASQSYVLLADDLRRFSSNLPLIIVNACNGEIEPRDKSLAALHVLENRPARTMLPDRADFTGLAMMHVRGFSSLRYPKHSYGAKTVNELREPHKVSILDLPKESDWVLYGPYPDKTLMRDALAYELAREMGQWAPRTRFVEVFVNESRGKLSMDNYVGLYVFEEKVTRDKSRVDVAKLGPGDSREPEITGGYIFKKDHTGRNDRLRLGGGGPPPGWTPPERGGFPTGPGGFPADPAGFLPPFNGPGPARTPRPQPAPARGKRPNPPAPAVSRPVTNYIAAAKREAIRLDDSAVFPNEEFFQTALQRNLFYFVEPEPDEITVVQRAYLKNYMNHFETALYGDAFLDPKAGYQAFIDLDSFIDYHLFSEITKNVDAFRFSTFYYKDRGGLLKMGPVWDWNLSFGNCDGKQGYMPEHWLWPQLDDQQYCWFRRLFEDPDFGQRYVDRWAQLRTNIFATAKVLARIDELAAQLSEAQARNFERWKIIGRDVTPNWFVGHSYQEEIDWMKGWTSNRLAWIEAQFVPAPTIERGAKISLITSVAGGKILYTIDGSDPRAAGGDVAKKAQPYKAPLALPKNSKIIARVHDGARWSAPLIVQ